jgi:CBS-domain-containing membrane protein
MSSPVLQRAQGRAGALGAGAYAAVLAFAVLALSGVMGLALSQPWLFPSLGPTVMLFFESPQEESSRPRNALVGHLVGIAVGWALLHLCQLQDLPPTPVGGLTGGHVVAGALSVALTSFVLVAIKHKHPPAGASTLIVSLGILSSPSEVLTMVLAVVLVTVVGWSLNVLLGQRPAA